jgi:hypothetical protein
MEDIFKKLMNPKIELHFLWNTISYIPLFSLIKREKKTQITSIGIERKDIIIDSLDIRMLIWELY